MVGRGAGIDQRLGKARSPDGRGGDAGSRSVIVEQGAVGAIVDPDIRQRSTDADALVTIGIVAGQVGLRARQAAPFDGGQVGQNLLWSNPIIQLRRNQQDQGSIRFNVNGVRTGHGQQVAGEGKQVGDDAVAH